MSTCSLSYISNASLATPSDSCNMGQSYFTTPSNPTPADDSYPADVEMLDAPSTEPRVLADIPELPASVAQSILFEAPREIRERIYGYCLVADGRYPVDWPMEPSLPRPRPECRMQPQLLRTCKIIYEEAAPLLYTLNRLHFHHPSDANMFVRVMASRAHARQTTRLDFHIRAADMRIWMPYLTSADEFRSLKADFPHLKELGVRFRSSKWQHSIPPEINIRTWSDDAKLEELIDGLRQVYFPKYYSEDQPAGAISYNARGLPDFTGPAAPGLTDPRRESFRHKFLKLAAPRVGSNRSRSDVPIVRVTCTCRVHPSHFAALTTGRRAIGARMPAASYADERPVKEGDAFRGFTPIDLQHRTDEIDDPDLGLAKVARTPFANKDGIFLALEIHSLSPKKAALH